MDGIIGRKVGMTQVFTEGGLIVPVTVIEAGPCFVTQVKSQAKDGYTALQLGYDETKPRRLSRPERGHLKNLPPLRKLVEFRQTVEPRVAVGSQITVDSFAAGDHVNVTGTSKGKGFAGVVKRHGFRGGPKTHGQSDRHRAPGSIGSGTTPGRVYRGTRMAGRMGNKQTTVMDLTVVEADAARNLLLIRGSVPGATGGYVVIRKTANKPPKKR
jgi:large subunit ribosomal protein L3